MKDKIEELDEEFTAFRHLMAFTDKNDLKKSHAKSDFNKNLSMLIS